MLDNEYAYELSADKTQAFNEELAKNLIRYRTPAQPVLISIPSDSDPHFKTINDLFGAQVVHGASLFQLLAKSQVHEAHVDANTLYSRTRHCALNFVVKGSIHVEWYTGNAREERNYATIPNYACAYYPIALNRLLFEFTQTVPVLVNTDIPHLGYSKPAGGLLVSIGFLESFERMRKRIKEIT